MRKSVDVTIPFDGRDKGKVFCLKEMSSAQAERWGVRAINSLIKAGVQVPEGMEMSGMAGIVRLGIRSLSIIPFEELEPLMNEMFACITVKPDARHPELTRSLVDGMGDGDDIEEVQTRIFLRQRLLELHLGFSLAGETST
jgi:hypothetical protein